MDSKFSLCAVLLITFGLCGCQTLHSMLNKQPENFAVKVTSRESLVVDLNRKIPLGTSASAAREIFKRGGWEIVPMPAGQTIFATKKDGFMGNTWMVLCALADERVVGMSVTYKDGVL